MEFLQPTLGPSTVCLGHSADSLKWHVLKRHGSTVAKPICGQLTVCAARQHPCLRHVMLVGSTLQQIHVHADACNLGSCIIMCRIRKAERLAKLPRGFIMHQKKVRKRCNHFDWVRCRGNMHPASDQQVNVFVRVQGLQTALSRPWTLSATCSQLRFSFRTFFVLAFHA